MRFGFSCVGLIFLLMLTIPNLIWTRCPPKGYEKYAGREDRRLLVLERAGEAAVSCLLLISRDLNVRGVSPWLWWLAAALALMLLYESFWVRYFRSERTMGDFYGSLLGIPVPGASLPVLSCMLLAVYGRNVPLFVAAAVLGVGHIGIHLRHRREAADEEKRGA